MSFPVTWTEVEQRLELSGGTLTGALTTKNVSINGNLSVTGSITGNATSATANGYYYTRSTAKESCGNMNTSIPGSTQYTYHNFYDVCRTPV